jgi:nucleoside-diphosphate-sugar epimerase
VYGLNSVVLRQSCIYGERQFGVEDQGWISWFTIAALLGRKITIFGDGKQVRDALWVDDLVGLYEKILNKDKFSSGGTFNIGGGIVNSISILELIEILKNKLGINLQPNFEKPRKGDQKCEMKARVLQISLQNIYLRSERFLDHMPACYVRAWSSTSPSFSINIKLGQKKTSVDPSVSEKKNTCLRPG